MHSQTVRLSEKTELARLRHRDVKQNIEFQRHLKQQR